MYPKHDFFKVGTNNTYTCHHGQKRPFLLICDPSHSCSPELVAKMSQDYSIYAYDYSEPGVPLVGCGLLSWAMATVNCSNYDSENPAPTRHIITGRISCNNFGFFSNDEVKETLEVKIKLMPVQTFTQAQFVQSVHTYNALSKAIPGGFDASAWTNYLNQHPNILAPPPHCSNTPALLSVPSRAPGERAPSEPLLVETQKRLSQPKPNKLSRDGDGLFTSAEESGEPPKKKARTNAGRVRKPSGGSRKKATAVLPPAPLSPIPELFPPPVTQFKKPFHVQPSPAPPTSSQSEDPAELVRGGSVSTVSFSSQEVAFSPEDSPAPLTVNSAVMASSPPTGHDDSTEESRVEYSPEPTSPVLPSLSPGEEIPTLSQEYAQELEDLFGDIKPELMNHDSPPAEPPAAVTLQAEQKTPVAPSFQPPAPSTLSTLPDDMTMSAAPSPNPSHEIIQPKPKPKRKYPRKPKAAALVMSAIPLDAVASSDIGEEGRNAKRSKSEKAARTAANVKERIHAQMVAAINEGKMPNYCMNCGAIETPTWRKVSMKDDSEGGEEGDGKGKKEKEVLLCNPCGLWHGSHKTMRPQDYWGGKKEEPAPKKPRSKKKKKPVSMIPDASSQATRQLSEPCTEPIIVPDEDEEQGLPMLPPSANSSRRLAMTPKGDRSAKGSAPEWEAASAASKRAFQSSPGKRGSAASPIDLENLEPGSQSPRRLLFPTKPSTNRSPVRKLLELGAETCRLNFTAVAGKENRAPEATGAQMIAGREIQRPTTPIKKRINPLRPRTPSSSPMKGGKLISPSPWNADIFVSGGKRRACGSGVSTTPERRTAQPPAQQCNISPTTELLEKIMSMANIPSTVVLADTSLGHHPCLSPIDPNENFDFDDNIFGTDMTMPSSPPPLFNLGDATEDEVNGWGEFLPSSPEFNNMDYGLDIFENMADVGDATEMDGESVKGERCGAVGTTPGATALTVDFSSYINEATKPHEGRLIV